jgi:hypothetical protein
LGRALISKVFQIAVSTSAGNHMGRRGEAMPPSKGQCGHDTEAVELAPDFAAAHAFAGHIYVLRKYVLRKQSRWTTHAAAEADECVRLSHWAIE